MSQTPAQRLAFVLARNVPPILLQQTWPIFIKCAALLGGLSLFVPFIPPPVSLTNTLGQWETALWGIMLTTGGVLGLYGMFRDRYLIHIAGLVLIGAPLVVYSWAVLLYRGNGAFFNAFLLFILGIGCYTRAIGMYVAHSTAEQRLNGMHHHRAHEEGGAGQHAHGTDTPPQHLDDAHGAYGHVDPEHSGSRRTYGEEDPVPRYPEPSDPNHRE